MWPVQLVLMRLISDFTAAIRLRRNTNLNSHEPTMIINNVIGLAKLAKVFNIPTILTTVLAERGGYLIKGLQDVFPEQKPIDRTFINTWQDEHVVDIVKKTGRKQLVLAELYTGRSASPCQRSTRSPKDMTSSSSAMLRAASRRKPTIWPCAAWFLRAFHSPE